MGTLKEKPNMFKAIVQRMFPSVFLKPLKYNKQHKTTLATEVNATSANAKTLSTNNTQDTLDQDEFNPFIEMLNNRNNISARSRQGAKRKQLAKETQQKKINDPNLKKINGEKFRQRELKTEKLLKELQEKHKLEDIPKLPRIIHSQEFLGQLKDKFIEKLDSRLQSNTEKTEPLTLEEKGAMLNQAISEFEMRELTTVRENLHDIFQKYKSSSSLFNYYIKNRKVNKEIKKLFKDSQDLKDPESLRTNLHETVAKMLSHPHEDVFNPTFSRDSYDSEILNIATSISLQERGESFIEAHLDPLEANRINRKNSRNKPSTDPETNKEDEVSSPSLDPVSPETSAATETPEQETIGKDEVRIEDVQPEITEEIGNAERDEVSTPRSTPEEQLTVDSAETDTTPVEPSPVVEEDKQSADVDPTLQDASPSSPLEDSVVPPKTDATAEFPEAPKRETPDGEQKEYKASSRPSSPTVDELTSVKLKKTVKPGDNQPTNTPNVDPNLAKIVERRSSLEDDNEYEEGGDELQDNPSRATNKNSTKLPPYTGTSPSNTFRDMMQKTDGVYSTPGNKISLEEFTGWVKDSKESLQNISPLQIPSDGSSNPRSKPMTLNAFKKQQWKENRPSLEAQFKDDKVAMFKAVSGEFSKGRMHIDDYTSWLDANQETLQAALKDKKSERNMSPQSTSGREERFTGFTTADLGKRASSLKNISEYQHVEPSTSSSSLSGLWGSVSSQIGNLSSRDTDSDASSDDGWGEDEDKETPSREDSSPQSPSPHSANNKKQGLTMDI